MECLEHWEQLAVDIAWSCPRELKLDDLDISSLLSTNNFCACSIGNYALLVITKFFLIKFK